MKRKQIPVGIVIFCIGAIILATSLVVNYILDVDRERGAEVNENITQARSNLDEKTRPELNLTESENEIDLMSGTAAGGKEGPSVGDEGGLISIEDSSSPVAVHLLIPDLGIDTLLTSVGVVPIGIAEQQNVPSDKDYEPGEGESGNGRYLADSAGNIMFAPGSEYYDLLQELIGLENDTQIIIYDLSQTQFTTFNEQTAPPIYGKFLEIRLDEANWVIPGLDDQATIIPCWQCGKDSVTVMYVALP